MCGLGQGSSWGNGVSCGPGGELAAPWARGGSRTWGEAGSAQRDASSAVAGRICCISRLRCAAGCAGSLQLAQKGLSSREQKLFWLPCSARALKGDEKPGGLAQRGCSDLKQKFKREERGEGMSFGRKSEELVKVWVPLAATRGEVVRAFGGFPWVQEKLAVRLRCRCSRCTFELCNTLQILNAHVL